MVKINHQSDSCAPPDTAASVASMIYSATLPAITLCMASSSQPHRRNLGSAVDSGITEGITAYFHGLWEGLRRALVALTTLTVLES